MKHFIAPKWATKGHHHQNKRPPPTPLKGECSGLKERVESGEATQVSALSIINFQLYSVATL